ncbi:hypothetical protein NDU88_003147 [Pleurodeles waltl]|uniref:Uncharacterized protein n=1 Tax=Pleurodeles waltl TaxID=8319 RepID=A0AAV7M2K8_PLEWA|nr:hypothetical protein NDU88_003147 [Pleurodeles waltl]
MTSGLRIGNREEGGEKRPASGNAGVERGEEECGKKESGKEECGEKESGEEKSDGIGEQFLPSRGEEEEEAADGGLNTVGALGGKTKNPSTRRCVSTPQLG